MKTKLVLILIVVIVFFITITTNSISITSVETQQAFIEHQVQKYARDFDSPVFDDMICTDQNQLCKDFIEKDLGYPCFQVEGATGYFLPHFFVFVCINNAWYSFHTGELVFDVVNEEFNGSYAQLNI